MQKMISPKTILATMAAILTLSIIACAATKENKKVDIEKLLKASGFKMGVADTPQKLAQLKKLPQRKIVPHEDGDVIYYIYADVEKCSCAFAGNEEAYKTYLKLAKKRQTAEEDQREGEREQQRNLDWGDWRFDQAW